MSATSEAAVPVAAADRHFQQPLGSRLLSYLPKGNLLDDVAWHNRHLIVWSLLLLHLPALTAFGLWTGHSPKTVGLTMAPILVCLALERLISSRRPKSFFTTAGIVFCSAALVTFSHGAIEAHFHFFIIIGFIALYQDWVPFLWEIVFTVLSHGLGSGFQANLMFNHQAGMHHPWTWSLVHGVAVLAACTGVVLFWRTTEDEQQKSMTLTKELGEAEVGRITSQLLVNLARRNQGMLYRQLEIINQLEEHEEDPDALAGLFRLDHLATRIRRNAESFLVLSGEEPARVWSNPVPLFDVIRAAIAETEELDRVAFMVDERLAIQGPVVTDLTHLLAELVENAARFSEPDSRVTIRTTPEVRSPGAWVITVEDRGIGMQPEDLVATNEILCTPRSLEAVTSQRLGLQVVARLAHRHSIKVALCSTSVVGTTAVVLLPPQLFAQAPRHATEVLPDLFGSPLSGHSGLTALSGRPERFGHRSASLDNSSARAEAVAVQTQTRAPEPSPAARSTVEAGSIQLNRRTPQANLAPELRGGRQMASPPAAEVQPADAVRARDAMSRYQASRQAALAECTAGRGDPP
ncbi:MAG TPA: ATP-binding protein [Kineosporiaceae bacterium]|nr:ATP-binding protein [Kineosporiaceae bacterium]